VIYDFSFIQMSEPYDYSYSAEIDRAIAKPDTATWLKHFGLLAIAFCTVTIAGATIPFGRIIDFSPADAPFLESFTEILTWAPTLYSYFIVFVVYSLATNLDLLTYALCFSIPLLVILISHEMGHYIACRLYGVEATLPFFIPTPPLIGPAGTFGAFIRIKSRIPSRKAIFDIGVAGPIAGFIALIPFAIIAIATIKPLPAPPKLPPGILVFSDPLLIKGLALLFGKDLTVTELNPWYGAAWMGALVTGLNLIPSGQLDGGHAIYAALSEKIHYLTGRIAFVVMAICAIVGMLVYSSPAGFLLAILLGVMMRVPHPEPWDKTPLDLKRKIIAVLTLIIFILCFLPIPIWIT
jgi:membrane-associated protease RseP (regulator of RpoE activity)